MNHLPEQLIDFWYSSRVRPLWFRSTSEFDQELIERYEGLLQQAQKGELGAWEETPVGALALVIICDQFPLNMYRNQAASFATEAMARQVVGRAIAKGFDQQLNQEQQAFLYLPYMHSENADDQERSVELFGKAGLENNLRFARHHQKIVRRFGRFPHRNAILGRESTPAELEYLASDEAFTG